MLVRKDEFRASKAMQHRVMNTPNIEVLFNTETYSNHLVLEPPDLLYLFWTHDNTGVTFELHVKDPSKWLAFGIMGTNFGDALVSWIGPDLVGSFSDNKLTFDSNSQAVLTTDRKQNWLPVKIFRQDNYSVHKFSRYIKVCNDSDLDQDVEIFPGKNRVFFTTGKSFDSNRQVKLHNVSFLEIELLTLNDGPFICRPEVVSQSFTSTPTGFYSNYADLVQQGQYRLYWNHTQTELIGEIHCRTTGWVGFGLSLARNQTDQSDLIIGWISNGVANFTVIMLFI
jgi:hypothetical protein